MIFGPVLESDFFYISYNIFYWSIFFFNFIESTETYAKKIIKKNVNEIIQKNRKRKIQYVYLYRNIYRWELYRDKKSHRYLLYIITRPRMIDYRSRVIWRLKKPSISSLLHRYLRYLLYYTVHRIVNWERVWHKPCPETSHLYLSLQPSIHHTYCCPRDWRV